MTEPTDAEIRELAATGNGVYQDDETAIWEITDPSLMKLVRAVLAKWGQPAHSGKPVAWLDPWAGTKVTTDYDAYGKHGIPLYTAPQPTQGQAGAPLSEESLGVRSKAVLIANAIESANNHDDLAIAADDAPAMIRTLLALVELRERQQRRPA